jgi:hypothetical protein
LTPWTFWRLTPHEFLLMVDGVQRRDDRVWYRVASLGMWAMAPWTGKKTPTPEKLMGLKGRRLRLWPTGD